MSTSVIFWNVITNERQEVAVQPGQTVKQALEGSGFIAPGSDVSVRDKFTNVVDDEEAAKYNGELLRLGLPGTGVRGGNA